jgi:hypothetical protein
MNEDSRPAAVFVSSILSILATLLGVLLTDASGLAPSSIRIGIFCAIVVTLMTLGFVYIRAYIQDLTANRKALAAADQVWRCVPMLVVFRRRYDRLEVLKNGDARLEWEFDLRTQPDIAISELTFPVFAEVDRNNSQWQAVEIESIEVNRQQRQASGSLRPFERRYPESSSSQHRNMLIEYYLLSVPVELDIGRSSCHVRVRMNFKGVFPKALSIGNQDFEAFFIDIPFVTEFLSVSLKSSECYVRKPSRPGGTTIDAISGLLETLDADESNAQSARCVQAGGELVWETDAPKLGYRYKFHFRLEEKEIHSPKRIFSST